MKKIVSSIAVIALIVLVLFLPSIGNSLFDFGYDEVDIAQDVTDRYDFIEIEDNDISYNEDESIVSVKMNCSNEEYEGEELLKDLEEISRFTLLEAEDQFDWPEKIDVSIECSDGKELSYSYYRRTANEEDGYEYVLKE